MERSDRPGVQRAAAAATEVPAPARPARPAPHNPQLQPAPPARPPLPHAIKMGAVLMTISVLQEQLCE